MAKTKNTRVVRFTNDDELTKKLREFTEYNQGQGKQALSFSEYLTRTTRMDRIFKGYSDDDQIIVDLSDRVITGENLQGVDFGEVILNNTTFSRCQLQNAKITSKVSMEGLKFQNGTNLQNAKISGDIGGISFRGETLITGLDLTDASGFSRCTIDPKKVKGTGIKIPFSSPKSFVNYLHYSNPDPDLSEFRSNPAEVSQEVEGQNPGYITLGELIRQSIDAAIDAGQRAMGVGIEGGRMAARGAYHGAQRVADAVEQAGDMQIPTDAQGVRQAVGNGMQSIWSAGMQGLARLGQGVQALTSRLASNMPSNSQNPDMHQPQAEGVQPAIEDSKIFVCQNPTIDLEEQNTLTIEDLRAWNKQKGKETLAEYAEELGKAPILKKLTISDIDFIDKDFGAVAFVGCALNNVKIEKSDLEKASFMDTHFAQVKMHEVQGNNLKLARSSFESCDIQKSNFDGADFTEAKFIDTEISNTRMQDVKLHRAYVNNLTIKESYLDNAVMDHIYGEGLSLTEVAAQNVDLSNAKIKEAKLTKVDLSNSTAYNAALPKAALTSVNFQGLEAASLELQKATIIESSFKNSNLEHSDFTGATLNDSSIVNSKMTKANLRGLTANLLQLEQIRGEGIDFQKAEFDFRETGKDGDKIDSEMESLSQSAVTKRSIMRDCDFSLSQMEGVKLKGSAIQNCTLYGAGINNAEFTNASITNTDLTAASLEGAQFQGGSLERSSLNGADLKNAHIGTAEKITNVLDLQVDQNTLLTGTSFGKDDAEVTYEDRFGKKTKVTLDEARQKSDKEQNINNASMLTRTFRATLGYASALLQTGGSATELVGSAINAKRKSRAGLVIGTLVGIGVGAAIIAATAASMGTALPVVAGVVIGTGAIVGGTTGHVVTNTAKGRKVFMGAATIASGIAFGTAGLVAAPVLAGYYLLTGQRNAITTALGSTLKTVGRLAKGTGSLLSGLTYSDEEIVEAHDIREARERTSKEIKQSRAELQALQPDPMLKRQSRIRRFFSRPFAKKGKKEQQVGITDSEIEVKALPSLRQEQVAEIVEERESPPMPEQPAPPEQEQEGPLLEQQETWRQAAWNLLPQAVQGWLGHGARSRSSSVASQTSISSTGSEEFGDALGEEHITPTSQRSRSSSMRSTSSIDSSHNAAQEGLTQIPDAEEELAPSVDGDPRSRSSSFASQTSSRSRTSSISSASSTDSFYTACDEEELEQEQEGVPKNPNPNLTADALAELDQGPDQDPTHSWVKTVATQNPQKSGPDKNLRSRAASFTQQLAEERKEKEGKEQGQLKSQ